MRRFAAFAAALVTVGVAAACNSTPDDASATAESEWGALDRLRPLPYANCTSVGAVCCPPDEGSKTDHCEAKGLGCNVATKRCEPCGGAAQVCCDGHTTAFSGRSYTPSPIDPGAHELCAQPASCDVRLVDGQYTGSRRCSPCGMQEGGACCPKDARYGLRRCVGARPGGGRLTCTDPWADSGGSCVPCGRHPGDRACMEGEACPPGRIADYFGVCVPCGAVGQAICDNGDRCDRLTAAPDWGRRLCVAAGNDGEACKLDGGCNNSTSTPSLSCQSGTCRSCGLLDDPCCYFGGKPGCSTDTVNGAIYDNTLECRGGACKPCGGAGELCCPGQRCAATTRGCAVVSPTESRCLAPLPPPGGGGGGGGGSGGGGGGSGSGGGGSNDWRTCSGAPYDLQTHARVVLIKNAVSSCLAGESFVARSDAEAIQCALARHGAALTVEHGVQNYGFAQYSAFGCAQQTIPAESLEDAETCASHLCVNCVSVPDGVCP